MKKKIIALAVNIGIMLAGVGSAFATPITIDFAGDWQNGQSFSGQIKYNTDKIGLGSESFKYYTDCYFYLDNNADSWWAESTEAKISVYDNYSISGLNLPPFDQISTTMSTALGGFSSSNLGVTTISLGLNLGKDYALPSCALPGELSIGNFSKLSLTINGTIKQITINKFTFSSPSPVPEPTSFILFGTGIAALSAYRRKSRKEV